MSIYKSKSKKHATTHTSLAASTLNKSIVMNSLTFVPHQLNVEVGFYFPCFVSTSKIQLFGSVM